LPGGAVTKQTAIVPLAGLWIVGAVLAALVAVIAGNWYSPLNFFHVVAGSLWTGIDLFMGFVIGPILPRLDPPARIALTRRLMPKMLLIMPTLVLVTLTSGWQLGRLRGFLFLPYPHHWWLVASIAIVGITAVMAYAILEPANITVLLELRKPQPNGLLISRLMRRFIYIAGINGVMLVANFVVMARFATW